MCAYKDTRDWALVVRGGCDSEDQGENEVRVIVAGVVGMPG
jgi:hypothetical protein